MRRMITTLGLAMATTAILGPAHAQQYCADRSAVTERLQTNFGESYTGGGLRNEEAIFEVWASEESGTWTILMTLSSGKSCIMASGTNWRGALPSDKIAMGVPS